MVPSGRALPAIVAVALALLVSGSATAQVEQLLPTFQVHSSASGFQSRGDVAVYPSGGFLVVWASTTSVGNDPSLSVQGRRFNTNGAAEGGDFQVNTMTTGVQANPRIDANSSGVAVVVWQNVSDIAGQRYDSSGDSLGTEFVISADGDSESLPSVAVAPSGDFLVAWSSDGSAGSDSDGASIQARRFNVSATPLGGRFQVNTTTPGSQRYPSTSIGSDGSAVVTWSESGRKIRGQRFDAVGAAAGSEFLVGDTYSTFSHPAVTHTPAGEFVVAWAVTNGGTAYPTIRGQRYDASGALGSPFNMTDLISEDVQPDVSASPMGELLFVWQSFNDHEELNAIRGQRRAANGTALGPVFQISPSAADYVTDARVGFDANGRYVVVWSHFEGADVFGRRSGLLTLPSMGALGLLGLSAAALVAGMRSLHARPKVESDSDL